MVDVRKIMPVLGGVPSLRRQLILVGAGVALFAIIGTLAWPLGSDQAVFAWAGQVVLHGGVPYRDAWDIKGPLGYYIYALAQGVFGRNEIAIRILDLMPVAVCCWGLRKLVLRVNNHDSFGANCAVLFFVLAYCGLGLQDTAQPDGWGGILVLVSVVLLLDTPWNVYLRMAATGFTIGLAVLLKPLFVLYLVLPTLFPIRVPGHKSPLLSVTACLLPFILTISVSILLLFELSGGLRDFFDVLDFIYSSYLPKRHFLLEAAGLPILLYRLNLLGLVIPCLVAPIGIRMIFIARMRRAAALLAVWLVLTVFSVVIQGRYWQYHWIPVLVALAAIFGTFVTLLQRQPVPSEPRDSVTGPWVLLVCLCVLAPSGAYALRNTYLWPSYVLGFQSRQQYVKLVTHPWSDWALERLAVYVADHSKVSDTILSWGWDPLVNAVSKRGSPTRFGYSYPIVAKGPLQAKYRELFMKEIMGALPRYIVVDTQNPWPLMDRSGLEFLNEFPEFSHLLRSRYRLVEKIDAFELWALDQ
jgi:hypothetical protein